MEKEETGGRKERGGGGEKAGGEEEGEKDGGFDTRRCPGSWCLARVQYPHSPPRTQTTGHALHGS